MAKRRGQKDGGEDSGNPAGSTDIAFYIGDRREARTGHGQCEWGPPLCLVQGEIIMTPPAPILRPLQQTLLHSLQAHPSSKEKPTVTTGRRDDAAANH
jgi:hypothetical protein